MPTYLYVGIIYQKYSSNNITIDDRLQLFNYYHRLSYPKINPLGTHEIGKTKLDFAVLYLCMFSKYI